MSRPIKQVKDEAATKREQAGHKANSSDAPNTQSSVDRSQIQGQGRNSIDKSVRFADGIDNSSQQMGTTAQGSKCLERANMNCSSVQKRKRECYSLSNSVSPHYGAVSQSKEAVESLLGRACRQIQMNWKTNAQAKVESIDFMREIAKQVVRCGRAKNNKTKVCESNVVAKSRVLQPDGDEENDNHSSPSNKIENDLTSNQQAEEFTGGVTMWDLFNLKAKGVESPIYKGCQKSKLVAKPSGTQPIGPVSQIQSDFQAQRLSDQNQKSTVRRHQGHKRKLLEQQTKKLQTCPEKAVRQVNIIYRSKDHSTSEDIVSAKLLIKNKFHENDNRPEINESLGSNSPLQSKNDPRNNQNASRMKSRPSQSSYAAHKTRWSLDEEALDQQTLPYQIASKCEQMSEPVPLQAEAQNTYDDIVINDLRVKKAKLKKISAMFSSSIGSSLIDNVRGGSKQSSRNSFIIRPTQHSQAQRENSQGNQAHHAQGTRTDVFKSSSLHGESYGQDNIIKSIFVKNSAIGVQQEEKLESIWKKNSRSPVSSLAVRSFYARSKALQPIIGNIKTELVKENIAP